MTASRLCSGTLVGAAGRSDGDGGVEPPAVTPTFGRLGRRRRLTDELRDGPRIVLFVTGTGLLLSRVASGGHRDLFAGEIAQDTTTCRVSDAIRAGVSMETTTPVAFAEFVGGVFGL